MAKSRAIQPHTYLDIAYAPPAFGFAVPEMVSMILFLICIPLGADVYKRQIQNIPKWIEIEQTFIHPEKYKDWEECVNVCAINLYHGLELDAALEIMQALENGIAIEDALEILDNQRHSGMSELLVRKIVLLFSRRGSEFWAASVHDEISLPV